MKQNTAFLTIGVFLSATLVLACSGSPAPKSAAGAASSRPLRVVLVEATGPGPELEAFLDRFQAEAIDSGRLSIVDARLSGATFTGLSTAGAETSRTEFQRTFPGDLLLSVSLPQCDPKVSSFSYQDTTVDGYRVQRTISSASISCTAQLETFRLPDGQKPETHTIKAETPYTNPGAEGQQDEPMIKAAREAGKKAARQLAKKL